MSFIRIKTIKGRRYYYRQTNKRTPDGKVRSIMEYLGPVTDDGQGVPHGPNDPPGFLGRILNRFKKRDDGPQALTEEEMIWRGWITKPSQTQDPTPEIPKPIEITGTTAKLTSHSASTISPSSAPASSVSSGTQSSDSTVSTSSPPSSSSSA